jgi:hypothetical protein
MPRSRTPAANRHRTSPHRWLVVVVIVLAGCGAPAFPTARPAIVAEVDRSIPIREANGLRADRAWIETVVSAPDSVSRWDVLVSPEEAREIDDRLIGKAIEMRRSIGMLADEGWVRALQANPEAEVRNGIPMSAEEAAAFDDRIHSQLDVAPAIVSYGEKHPDEWAGTYIDRVTGAVIVLFTGHAEAHRQALAALVAPGVATVEVRQVRWSTAQLDDLNRPIWASTGQAWFKEIGVELRGGGASVIDNVVTVDVAVAAPDPGLAARIVEHFGGAEWLKVEVNVIPALALPFGTLQIEVLDMAGAPVTGVVCEVVGDVRGAGGDDISRDTNDAGLCRWDVIHATGYDVQIWRTFRHDLLGTGRVVVPAKDTGRTTIIVDPS